MPFVDDYSYAPRTPQYQPPPDVSWQPDWGDIFKAVGEREYPFMSLGMGAKSAWDQWAANHTMLGLGEEPGYDPVNDPQTKGFEQYAGDWLDSKSRAQTRVILNGITRNINNQQLMASGGYKTLGASLALGLANPLNVLPFGYAANGFNGGRFVTGALEGLSLAGGTATADEAMLRASQGTTRPASEMVQNIAEQALMGAFIGGSLRKFLGHDIPPELGAQLKRDLVEAVKLHDEEPGRPPAGVPLTPGAQPAPPELAPDFTPSSEPVAAGEPAPAGSGEPASVGAAAAPRETLEQATPKPSLGIGELSAMPHPLQNPLAALSRSPSLEARSTGRRLAENAERFKGEGQGVASPQAVETRAKQWQGALYRALEAYRRVYNQYRLGKGEPGMFASGRAAVEDLRGQTAGKLTEKEFGKQVAQYMRGEPTDNPAVREAGDVLKEHLVGKLRDAALHEGFIDEEDLKKSPSFLYRVWDTRKIKAQYGKFKGKLEDWLSSDYEAERTRSPEEMQKWRTLKENADANVKRIDEGKLIEHAEQHNRAEMDASRRLRDQMDKKLTEYAQEMSRPASEVESWHELKFRADDNARRIKDEKLIQKANSMARKRELQAELAASERLSKRMDENIARHEAAKARTSDEVARWEDLRRSAHENVKAIEGQRKSKIEEMRAERSASSRLSRRMQRNFDHREEVLANHDPGDISDSANEIINRILRSGGRGTHANAEPGITGRLRERKLNMPDKGFSDFLVNDVQRLMRMAARTAGTDIELTKEFGSVNLKDELKAIEDDYTKLRENVPEGPKQEAQLVALDNRMRQDIRHVEAIRDRLRGTFDIPDNPDGFANRAGKFARRWTLMRLGGGFLPASLSDVGGIALTHGFYRMFGKDFQNLMRNTKGIKANREELRSAGLMLDRVLHARAHAFADIGDNEAGHTMIERAADFGAEKMGILNGMGMWSDWMKDWTGQLSIHWMQDEIEKMAKGTIKKSDAERLAHLGIDKEKADMIYEQLQKHGETEGTTKVPMTDSWEGSRGAYAREVFRAALAKDVDTTIVTPGQEIPPWMSKGVGRMAGMFRSFTLSALSRITTRGLQQWDSKTLQGLAMMVAMGALSYRLKTPEDKISNDPRVWIKEGIDRSGVLGWLMDANNLLEKATSNRVGLSRLAGVPPSQREAARNFTDTLFGPAFGGIEDIVNTLNASAKGEMSPGDINRAQRLLPYQNLFYLKWLFNQMEDNSQ